MKIRNGFVSNSSSSSFCIVGSELTDEIDSVLDQMNDWTKLSQNKINTHTGESGSYIGMSIYYMKEDETLREFKIRVKNTMKDVLDIDDIQSRLIIDCGYNG